MAKQKDGPSEKPAARRPANLTEATLPAPAPARPASRAEGKPVAAQAGPAPVAVDQATIAAAVVGAMAAVNATRPGMEAKPDLDKTVAGGRYIVDGVCVDAHGNLCDEPGDADEAVDQWVEREADVLSDEVAATEAASAAAEADAEAEPTDEEKAAEELSEARAKAADDVRKRAEAIAKDAAKDAGKKKE